MRLPIRIRSLLTNILLTALAALVTLGLAEALLRVAAHHIIRKGEFLSVGTVFNLDDPPMGFSLVPDSSRIVVKGGAFLMRETISQAGLRDIEQSVERNDGVKRITVLGDSFMYGDGVETGETMPRRLAGMMPGIEVINAGVRAYDLGQQYLFYKHRVRRFRADVVLLSFFINDLSPDPSMASVDAPDGLPLHYQRKAALMDREGAETPRGLSRHVSSWLRSHSLLYVLARQRLDGLAVRRRGNAAPRHGNAGDTFYLSAFRSPSDDPGAQAEWRRAYVILDELSRLVTGDHARLAIVLIPAPWQTSEERWVQWVAWLGVEQTSLSRRRPQEIVQTWCERSGTPCLDLLEAFEGTDRDRLYFQNDHHWTAEGHALAARHVRDFLLAHPP